MSTTHLDATHDQPTGKPTFYQICGFKQLDASQIAEIGRAAGVSSDTMDRLFYGEPIKRREAEAILRVLSESTGEHYTLNTVIVALMKPTFSEIWQASGFIPETIAPLARVEAATIENMIEGRPVHRLNAVAVLEVLSSATGGQYTLENTEVVLIAGDDDDESDA